MFKQADPNGLQRFFGGARKVTGFLSNPLKSVLPQSSASAPLDSLKNIGAQVVSPKPLGIASNLGYVTQIPGWLGTAGTVNTGINTADQLFEYGEKGIGKTLNDMKDNLNTKHFQNSIVDTGNDVLNAVSRPLVSLPLGIREGVKAIAPAFKYRPGMAQSSPMHGATRLMGMNKRSSLSTEFLTGLLKAAADYDPHASVPLAALTSLLGAADFYPSYKDVKNQKLTELDKVKNIDKGKLFSPERSKAYEARSMMLRSSREKIRAALAGAGVGALAGGAYGGATNNHSWTPLLAGALGGGLLSLPVGGALGASRYNSEVVDNPSMFRKQAMNTEDLLASLSVGGATGLGIGVLGGIHPAGATEEEKKNRWRNALIAGGLGGGLLTAESMLLRHYLPHIQH